MPDVPSGLGPWCVGVRVVVRRRLPGPPGPSGGPALTDLLGVLEEWGERTLTVRSEDGTLTVVDRSDIVAGKPVPPRAPVRLRVSAADAQLRAGEGWPPLEQARLGEWVLRASAGFSSRANSALLVGDPGRPWDDALAELHRFYADRGLPTRVQSIVGSAPQRRLGGEGWVAVPGEEAGVGLRLGGVARAIRAVRPLIPATPPRVSLSDVVDDAWLADDARALAHREAALAVLQGPEQVTFAAITDTTGLVVAKGRAALAAGTDVWLCATDLWVAAAHRRRGLGATVMLELLRWGAERGAGTACLQVRLDNQPAAALYDRLGLATHHTYRYLAPPG